MLEIYIDILDPANRKTTHKVDLTPDIQIPITIENPMMQEDRIPVPSSLNFELPPTANNLKLFGYPDRAGSYFHTKIVRRYNCQIRFSGLIILSGNLQLQSFDQTIKCAFQGIDYLESISRKLFEADFGKVEFEGDHGSTPISYTNPQRFEYNYVKWAKEATEGLNNDLVVAPLVIRNKNQPFSNFEMEGSMYEQFKQGYKTQDAEFINLYNPFEQTNWIHWQEGTPKYHAKIFPMFRIGFMLDTIFKGLLVGNVFRTHRELRDVVMPTTYFPNWTSRSSIQDSTTSDEPVMLSNNPPVANVGYADKPYIRFNQFMPDVAANEFVNSILNTFCLSIIVIGTKIHLVSNTSIFERKTSIDWSSKMLDTMAYSDQQAKVYVYGYSDTKTFNPADKNIKNVLSIYAMMEEPYDLNEEEYYEQIFYIQETRQYIAKSITRASVSYKDVGFPARENEDQITYSVLLDGLGGITENPSEKYEIKSNVTALVQIPAAFHQRTQNFSIIRDPLQYLKVPGIDLDDRSKRPSIIPLVIYRGYVQSNLPNRQPYPFVSGGFDHTRDLALAWDGTNGLIERFHIPFKNWIEKDKLKGNAIFLLTPSDLQNLDITQKCHVNGRNYFIEKMQYVIRYDRIDPTVVDLIEV